MKKQLALFLFALFISAFTFAQEFEGKIIFDISISDLPEQMKQYASMMPKESTMFIAKDKVRTETQSMMGLSVNVVDNKNKTSVMMMDMMGNKVAVKSTEADVKKSTEKMGKMEVKETEETKTIAGYACKKAIVKYEGGESGASEFEVFYSSEIMGDGSGWANPATNGIKGFPMEYQMKQGGMTMKFTARSVAKEKVKSSMFQIPDDYKIMSPEDFKKMMGGMNGGK